MMGKRVDWSQWDSRLGTMFDGDLAERIGCSVALVNKRRNELGIPPFIFQPGAKDIAYEAREEKQDRPISVLSERVGVSNALIVRYWKELGGLDAGAPPEALLWKE